MEFSRVGQHTIKCVITEDEITGLGYSIDDIMSNGDKTQEFMNHIFDLAEQEFDMDFELGVKTVRADFLPNHTVSLTFSEKKGESVTDHIKDLVNGLLNAIPQDKWDEIKPYAQDESYSETKGDNSSSSSKREQKKQNNSSSSLNEKVEETEISYVVAMMSFSDFSCLENFAKRVNLETRVDNSLYKIKNKYVLVLDLSDCEEEEVLHLSVLADEYSDKIEVGPERESYIREHGKCIIVRQAIDSLKDF
ncbi:adaptor protein MecA [Lachnobacterium bovis]|uniref:Adapter protein MecA 1/2 n=1 Tax=Lachnobacterium bovis TaxID=140626 RepID=A0A1H9UHH9_9FIRM|nr:adaptor protein MecA [Lachnobacterium bovis]SES08644.1 adapter protein MecA 1/2 [Lachnobacterium bovis]